MAIEGEPVGYTAELQAEIAERRPGEEVTDHGVSRSGRPVDVDDPAQRGTHQQPAADSWWRAASESRSSDSVIVVEPLDASPDADGVRLRAGRAG